MVTFTRFREIVRAEHGIWESAHVRFSHSQSQYTACYQPNFPNTSLEDEEVHLVAPCGLWTHSSERIRRAAEEAAPGALESAVAAARAKCQGVSFC